MLLKQCAAGAVYDQRLQRGCAKVSCPALSIILYFIIYDLYGAFFLSLMVTFCAGTLEISFLIVI